MYHPSVTMEEFNALFEKSPNQIIRRRCFECVFTHRDIYYRRFDPNGVVPADLDILHILKNYWYDIPGNQFHIDFELYSTYEDALNNENAWQFCNFNHANVGFPRDCGPTVRIHNQWNAWEPVGNNHGRGNVAFYVEAEGNVIAPTQAPTVTQSPSLAATLVVCGALHGEPVCGSTSKLVPVDSLHAVRCCSDVAKSGYVQNSGCSVWGESEIGGTCYGDETLESATNICASDGARLCTEAEVEAECTRGSGCGYDARYVWVERNV